MERSRSIGDLVINPRHETELLHAVQFAQGRPERGLLQEPRGLRTGDNARAARWPAAQLLHKRRIVTRNTAGHLAAAVDDRHRRACAVGAGGVAAENVISPVSHAIGISILVIGANAVKLTI